MNVTFPMASAMTFVPTAAKMAVSATPVKTPASPAAREAQTRGMSADAFRSLFSANAKKDAVASGVATALSNPKLKAPEHSKEMVRQRIEEIKKRLNIFRNLYANDPKGMAKALAQVFKDLRAALKEYKAAGEQELGMSKDLSADALGVKVDANDDVTTKGKPDDDKATANPEATIDKTEAAEDTSPVPAVGETATGAETTVAASSQDRSALTDTPAPKNDRTTLLGPVEQTFRKTIGEDVLGFAKEVGGLVNYIEEKLLNPARLQMKARKPDKETEEAFKEVDKTLKELRKDIEDTARDIKQAVPAAGMHLDVTA